MAKKMTDGQIEAALSEAYDKAGIGWSPTTPAGSVPVSPDVLVNDSLDGNGVYAVIPVYASVDDITLGKNFVTMTDRLGRAKRIAGRSRKNCRILKLTASGGWVLVHEVDADRPMPWHDANGVQRSHRRQWKKYLRAVVAARSSAQDSE